MTTLAANTSATITLDGDDVLTTDGNATFQITPTSGGKGEGYLTGHQTLGPYGQYVTIVLTSINNPVTYSQESDVSESEIARYGKDASGNITSLVSGDGTSKPWVDELGQTVYLAGDSLTANNYITTGVAFANFAAEGWFNHMNARLGSPFRVIGNVAVAGTYATDFRDTQVPAILALTTRPKYVAVTCGHNDIFSNSKTAAETASALISGLDALFMAGIIPIYTTVWARSFSTQALFNIQKNCNELIRQYFQRTKRGLFWDGFQISMDPDTAVGAEAIRSGWTYDSAPNIHPNNLGAYWLGKYAANAISKFVNAQNILPVGADDYNATGDSAQLLTNPMMTGTGGTAGTGVSGDVPTGWSVLRVAGTPTVVCAMVSIVDPITGLKIANGCEMTITAGAANNEIQIVNTSSIHARMASGGTYEAECGLILASPVNVDRVRFRVAADSGQGESGWWGSQAQTAANYPEGFTYPGARSRQITAQGAPVSGLFDARIRFSGIGSAVFTVYAPRVRSVTSAP